MSQAAKEEILATTAKKKGAKKKGRKGLPIELATTAKKKGRGKKGKKGRPMETGVRTQTGTVLMWWMWLMWWQKHISKTTSCGVYNISAFLKLIISFGSINIIDIRKSIKFEPINTHKKL